MQNALTKALQLMLKPFVRFCLRKSIGLQEVVEALKIVFIEVAVEEIKTAGEKVNMSRLSTFTGVHRRDVFRIYKEGEIKDGSPRFVSKVIGLWRRNKRFCSSSGRPRVLGIEGSDCEFNKLVESVSRDLHPSSVLFALQQSDSVQLTPNGVKLKAATYEPRKDTQAILQMLSRDIEKLIQAVLDNIESKSAIVPNFHAYTFFDNIGQEDLPKIRQWLIQNCARFHKRVETYLARFDLDFHPRADRKGGYSVGYGSFTSTPTEKSES